MNQSNSIDEPFLQQEILLGLTLAIGMILMVASDGVGRMLVMVTGFLLSCIYLLRIFKSIRDKEKVIHCCFGWFNNSVMVLAVSGILMLMLMNAYHRQVFYSSLAILALAMVLNSFMLRNNIRGIAHVSVQLRLLIAMVALVVFFLL